MKKNFLILWKTAKDTWNISLLKKIKRFGKMEYELPERWQKVVEQNSQYVVQ